MIFAFVATRTTEAIMAAKEIVVKKYVVRLSCGERSLLETMTGKGATRRSACGRRGFCRRRTSRKPAKDGATTRSSRLWKPAHPWFTGCASNWWKRGFEAVLSRKPRATPSVPRIFDGEKGAKLIALALSQLPKGRARWTLRLLENKVVELNIVDRASDSTIGRTLKKTFSSRI